MVLLKGEKVHLRPLEPDDMKDFFYNVNNPEAVGEFDAFGITEWSEVEKLFKEPKGPHEFTMLIIEENMGKSDWLSCSLSFSPNHEKCRNRLPNLESKRKK